MQSEKSDSASSSGERKHTSGLPMRLRLLPQVEGESEPKWTAWMIEEWGLDEAERQMQDARQRVLKLVDRILG